MNSIMLAFDIGGTSIKAGAVHSNGKVIEETVCQFPSFAHESRDNVLDHFARIAQAMIRRAEQRLALLVTGIGYAFPGPFDYENGISYMKGLYKFESLYGVPIGEELQTRFASDPFIAAKLTRDWRLMFENDAGSFALGEALYGEAAQAARSVCFTLGTGVGSGFIQEGKLLTDHPDVPENGWVYHLPYQANIADNIVSRRGVLQLADELGLHLSADQDVHHLAAAAFSGNSLALELFEQFGTRMAHILAAPLRKFQPDVIVLGGQISKSGSLFVPAFKRGLQERDVGGQLRLSKNTLYSTFQGLHATLSRTFHN